MRSWDFFDTLLGRACGAPWRVFELIGGEEFKLLRQRAEQESDFTFEGIYSSLKKLTGWSQERIDEMRTSEYDWEKKLAFPIRVNVSQVQPGDLVITDTYFNNDQISELAGKLNLPQVSVFASYGGKHTGRIWRQLRNDRYRIDTHTGDNRRADYDMPRSAGFAAQHFRDGDPSGLDRRLTESGHWDVAALSRCVRLQNPYLHATPQYRIWQKQADYNVPYLLLCAALLRQRVQEKNARKLWFLSRDTCLLQRVFNKLYPDVPTETFYASRQLYLHPTESFIEYARAAAAQPGALFVDLQGTGKSVRAFERATGLSLPYLYCTAPHNCPVEVDHLYFGRNTGTELEVMNYDLEGRVIDVRGGQPIRAAVEYNTGLVAPSHAAVDCLLKYAFQPTPTPQLATLTEVLRHIRAHSPRELIKQHQIYHPVVPAPDAES
jgi:hypothetical protein